MIVGSNEVYIEILQDTPFDKKGTLVSIKNFRMHYSHICVRSVSDKDLIEYLENDLSFKDWFKIKK